ncbi:MAG: hypothetical protein ABSF35_22415 [Polyangia bacterium]|jgi:hypothetical protein
MRFLVMGIIVVFAGCGGCSKGRSDAPHATSSEVTAPQKPERMLEGVDKDPDTKEAVVCAAKVAADQTHHTDWVVSGVEHEGSLWRVHFTMPNPRPLDRGGGLEVQVRMPGCKRVLVLFQP